MEAQRKKLSSKEISKNEQYVQIYLPLILFVLLVIILSFFVIQNSTHANSNVAQWANISSVILISPTLFFTLFWLAVVGLIIFGLSKAIKWIPIQISKVYVFIIKIAIFIMNGSNKLVSPLISSRAKLHSLKSIFKKGS